MKYVTRSGVTFGVNETQADAFLASGWREVEKKVLPEVKKTVEVKPADRPVTRKSGKKKDQ